ncbi:50S ribosomal protein L15 [Spiroplasma platyhelix]|uniref:Large ribosomal subunit protein uL15 n=1 Tax=Spiroplasma platyhelix PALS-1 TaxID=1276218 RepID=A0A846UDU9_9MOLU|nr:50S ribosomal protein L15 [Spiroplasma platyhelix]NKE38668.1 50S ribosomal protein L15 [Spiroplasma platyhelix PALS-1]
MKLHELQATPFSRKKPKRKGRGTSSGLGKTAGKGTKGQNARTGGGVRPGFEGGQTPLYRRISKRGFTNPTTIKYAIINLDQINSIKETDVTPQLLYQLKIIKDKKHQIKVLGNGTLATAKNIQAHKFSNAAKLAIEKIGGKAEVI